ncbi:TPA: hypothetical protein N0F65_000231 [Lagenidium giganteum]|uniref:Uncharacterized protein n=1 Tax=Lagenidium giganteum TaxID=4803 RepID=A0AAV2YBF5_9STRA|nr:TPA: hypothetical protein N0F65_000231 [Lagenidium giganteum]
MSPSTKGGKRASASSTMDAAELFATDEVRNDLNSEEDDGEKDAGTPQPVCSNPAQAWRDVHDGGKHHVMQRAEAKEAVEASGDRPQNMDTAGMARMIEAMAHEIATLREAGVTERRLMEARLRQLSEENGQVQAQQYAREQDRSLRMESLGSIGSYFERDVKMDDAHRQPKRNVPTNKQLKLSLEPFDGTERYAGLGARFFEWGKRFQRQVEIAEASCGYVWNDELRLECLSRNLSGQAGQYYHENVELWWSQMPRVDFVMNRMLDAYRATITMGQAVKLFTSRKDLKRNWNEHYVFLMALSKHVQKAHQLELHQSSRH